MNLGPISTPLNPGSFFKPFIPLEQGAIEGFALEMTRRASQTELPEGTERTVDDEGLQKAIEGAVGFVEDNFGDQAARTFMGIVLKDASGRTMDETALGDAFVNGLEFLDRTFGTASGDKAMAYFNGELNQALNGYYQNGQNESFLAVDMDQAQDELGNVAGQAASAMMKKFTKNSVDPDSLLMNKAQDDLEETLDKAGEGGGETVADEMAPLVDENGLPIEEGEAGADGATGGAQAVSSGSGSESGDQAAQAVESKPGKRVAGAKRRGRGGKVRRRRVDSNNPYDKSGLTPGQVLDKKI